MKHASLRLAVLGALAALALAGCGGGSKTSQTQTKTKPPTTNLDSREAGCARLLCCLGPGPCVKTLVARGADAFGTENNN